MASATVRVYQATDATGATTTDVDAADGTSPTFGTDDAVQSTTPVQVPTATGTHYSAQKQFYLNVTVAGTTAITNRQIKYAAGIPTGVQMFFKDTATYVQGAAIANSGSDGPAVPAGYAALTTAFQQWDNTSHVTSATGRNGDYVSVPAGVDSSYSGSAGSVALPDLSFSYDEA